MDVLTPLHDASAFRKGPRRSLHPSSNTRTRGPSKQLQRLFTLYHEATNEFLQSQLSERLQTMLHAKTRPRVSKAVSLGLGSLVEASKDQPRRIKQLVIFMAIAASIQTSLNFPLYAQDPTFTKTDEDFLGLLGIQVLRTPSASHLGEAGDLIDAQTLVYCPFLTIAAYTQLLGPAASRSEEAVAPVVVGDDFNALKLKWEKRTAEHRDVDVLTKEIRRLGYQRRVVSGEGFWKETDHPFPMALYWRQSGQSEKAKGREEIPGESSKGPIKGKL
jgi:hypothetical protein